MTVLEARPAPEDVLPFVEEQVRTLQEGGMEPRFILAGPEAYDALCRAVAARFGRAAGAFEQYQWLTIVADPFRGAAVCVVPAPREVAAGVGTERLD